MEERDKRIELLEQEVKYLSGRVSDLREMNIVLNRALTRIKLLSTPRMIIPAEESHLDGA